MTSNEIKVGYLTIDQFESTAYVDADTGVGTDKYTDEDVIVRWDDSREQWLQVVAPDTEGEPRA